MKYSSIKFSTPGERVISILRNSGVPPGDVDYFIYYDDIGKFREIVNTLELNGILTADHVKILVDEGILIRHST